MIEVAFPDPAEQRKIAGCLGSLDDWIAAESRRLAALRRHKTGLMQQLFPRPGQTRPRLRFPEFQNAGEWEPTAKFGEICQVRTRSFLRHVEDRPSFCPTGTYPVLTHGQSHAIHGGLDLSDLVYIDLDDAEVYWP